MSVQAGDTRQSTSWGRTILKVAVSTVLMVFLLRRISFQELGELIRNLDAGLLLAAVVCFFVSNALAAAQWYRLLGASGIHLRFARAFRFYFVGLFFNNFLPANIGGDAVKVYDVSRDAGDVYEVIAVTLLDRLIGIFSLCLLACTAAVWLMATDAVLPYGYYLLLFVGCMIPAAGGYFVKSLGNLLRALIARIRPFALDARMSAVLDHLGRFKSRRRLVVQLIGLSLVIQTLRVSTHVLVGVALGIALDWHIFCQFFVYIPILSLAMIPPVTINGLGVREGLGILLFANAGLARTDAFTMEFLTYAVSVVVSLLGLVFFLTRRARGDAENEGDAV